jgi:fructoselysine-6-P-deglycase FrlB-like protein
VSSPELFHADILAEPETLGGLLDAYGGPASPLEDVGEIRERRIVFVGMGSSRFAALSAAARLRAAGLDAHVEYSSAALSVSPAPETLVVAISSSGSTGETVEVARSHRGTSRVVAVTNRPESELGETADVVLPLLAGEEAGGIACRTFQATVAVLLLLAGRVTGGTDAARLRPAVASVAGLIASRDDWLAPALEILGGGAIDVVAPAERLSSAEQAALMLREAPRIRAAACETGDWLHVDLYLTRPPGYRAILLSGSRFDPGFVEWIERRGCAFVAVGAPVVGAALHVGYAGAGDPDIALLVETTAIELLAAELWRRSLA